MRDVFEQADFILGRSVGKFEQAFSAYCEVEFGVAVNSGTSALHLALLAAGVRPGDEVITSAFTFIATPAAIEYVGARPVLVDIDPSTFTLNPEAIERAVTVKTRAIIPVHLYGHPADMDPITNIAEQHGLSLIEDAAHAHGASYKARQVGSLADVACFSFYPSKNLGACGEGGMLLSRNRRWADAARAARNWGLDPQGQQTMKGYNFRMDSLQGALLGVKLRHLDEWNRQRCAHAARYNSVLEERAPPVMPWAGHVYHIYAIRAPDRVAAQQHFHKHGIETSIHYPKAMHMIDAWNGFGYHAGDFPEAERAARETLSIPVYPELTPDEVDRVATALGEWK